jgi:hypothetical protein
MRLIFMGLVHCGNVENWSMEKHGIPVGAVFGTNEKYPKAIQVVGSRALIHAPPEIWERELGPFGIQPGEVKKAFEASCQIFDSLIIAVDPKTSAYKPDYKGPKMSELDRLPLNRDVARTVDEIHFMNRFRTPSEILLGSIRRSRKFR